MEEMAKLVAEMEALCESFKKDANAFVNDNNKAAAARARKATLELEKLGKQFRKDSIAATK